MATDAQSLGMSIVGDAVGRAIDYSNDIFQQNEARRWAEEMWNKQNEYNLPVNQVKRLKEAGINPNLAFGSSASALGTSVPGAPDVARSKFGSAMSSHFERMAIMSNIQKQKEDTRREKLNNDLFESLIEDKKAWQRAAWLSDQEKFRWNIEHYYDYKETERSTLGLKRDQQIVLNRISEIEEDIAKAKKKGDWTKVRILDREEKHLKAKYDYEDWFYNNKMNPYETNTLMGWSRYGVGLFNNVANNPRKVLPWLVSPVFGLVDYWRRIRKDRKGGVE